MITRDQRVYHVNTTTLEVYHQNVSGWDAPGWLELPDMVREAIWKTHG